MMIRMNKLLKTLVVIVLAMNTSGAFYGGLSRITDPTGGKLQMPLSYLNQSPFSNYFWPGIILFTVNGLFGVLALAALLFRSRLARGFVAFQGLLLGGWITVQMILLQLFYAPLQLPFLLMGAMLLLIAWLKPESDS